MGLTYKQLKALEKGRKLKKPVIWNSMYFNSINELNSFLKVSPGTASEALSNGHRLKGHYIEES